MKDTARSIFPNQPPDARLSHVDIAKGIAMLAIVAIHNPLLMEHGGKIFNGLLSFALPVFFICCGTFSPPDKAIGAIALARTRGLLVPYAATIITIALIDRVLLNKSALHILWGGLYGTGATVAWVPLWFLPLLWLVSMAALLIARCVEQQRLPRLSLTLLSMLLFVAGSVALHEINSLFPQVASRGLPFSLDLLPLTLAYALVGLTFRVLWLRPRYNVAVFLIAAPTFLLLQFGPAAAMDLNLRRYDSGFFSTLSALSGACAVFSFAGGIRNVRVIASLIAAIGRESLVICIFHFPIQEALVYRLPVALFGDVGPISISISALALSMSLWWVLSKSSASRFLFAITLQQSQTHSAACLRSLQPVDQGKTYPGTDCTSNLLRPSPRR
jgi:fucose 4-O-acetylase-like acetyltransferase